MTPQAEAGNQLFLYKVAMDRREYQKQYKEEYNKTVKRVNLTLTQTEYSYFKKIADREGVKVGKIIKTMALAQIGKTFYQPEEIQKKLDDLIFLIRNIANNLNQIARHSNTIKIVLDENKVFTYIKNLEQSIKEHLRK